ncbi:glycosyltransferase family 2 protein [Nonomuraea thailandensis]
MPPSLSVVICSYNGAARLGRTLDALRAHPVLEVIVVDDGSQDATGDVARDHGATVVRHEENRGAAAARDTGLRAAKGQVVAFLDDDCEPSPTGPSGCSTATRRRGSPGWAARSSR